MRNNNWPPFYIEPDRPTFAQQFRDMADAMEIMEKLAKKGEKPKEEKKDEKKTNVFKNFLIASCTALLLFPFAVWMWLILFMDIISRAKHLTP